VPALAGGGRGHRNTKLDVETPALGARSRHGPGWLRAVGPLAPGLVYLTGQAITVPVVVLIAFARHRLSVQLLWSWDGQHFLSIARQGYTHSVAAHVDRSPAFLPGYSIAIFALAALEGLAALVGEAPVHRSPMARRAVLVAYIDLVTAHEDLIRVLSQDPSVKHRPAQAASGPLYERLTAMLSGDENPDTAQQARVRVALGGIHAALLHAAADDDSTVVREATLMAACGALGISRHRRT
jgi:hypothetical protein